MGKGKKKNKKQVTPWPKVRPRWSNNRPNKRAYRYRFVKSSENINRSIYPDYEVSNASGICWYPIISSMVSGKYKVI